MIKKMDKKKLNIEDSHRYNTVGIKKEVNAAMKAAEDIKGRVNNL